MPSESGRGPGAVALVGAGEYTPAMSDTDAYLIATLGGPGAARVALLPTASGREPGSPERWNAMGLRHFGELGVADIRPTRIIDAASAAAPDQLALLRDATFFYFSGGDPQHVIATMRGSPAWEAITAAYARGAVLAGCSAGAMALAGFTLSIRQVMGGAPPEWQPSLGIVPSVIVFPHFDRMSGFIGQQRFSAMLAAIPAGRVAVGVDEDTALVRLTAGPASDGAGPARWRVMGRQTVTVFPSGAEPRVLRAGEEVAI